MRGSVPSPAPPAGGEAQLLAFLVLQAPFAFLAIGFAYHFIFSWFQTLDDEGYLMMAVRYLLRGERIYDDVPMLYGPGFFAYKWLLHGVLHVPLTHDAIRLETLGIWLASVLAVGLFVAVNARTIALALAAQLAVLDALRMLANEPGHPQALIVLLVVLSLLVALAHHRRPRSTAFLLGALAATVLCIKLNLGVFLIAAVGVTVLAKTRPTAAFLTIRAGALLLFLALPALLMTTHLGEPWAARYAGLVTLSAAPVALLLWRDRSGSGGWSDLGPLVAGAAAACGIGIFFILARGSSPAGMIESLWVMPQRLRSSLAPAPIGVWSLAAAGASLVAGVVLTSVPIPDRLARTGCAVLQAAFAAVVFGIVVLSSNPPFLLRDFATPWIWLALLPPRAPRATADFPNFPRMLAVTSSLMLSLWAYPVPGTQIYLATFLLAVPAALAAADAAVAARASSRFLARPAVGATALVAVLLLVALHGQALRRVTTVMYAASTPLELPGTTRLRLDQNRVAELTTLVRELRAAPDTFLCTDGCYSLYFWSGKEPPSPILIGHDIDLFTPAQTATLTAAVLSRPQARLVLSPSFPQFEKPFYQNLFRYFSAATRIGTFVIATRRDVAPAAP